MDTSLGVGEAQVHGERDRERERGGGGEIEREREREREGGGEGEGKWYEVHVTISRQTTNMSTCRPPGDLAKAAGGAHGFFCESADNSGNDRPCSEPKDGVGATLACHGCTGGLLHLLVPGTSPGSSNCQPQVLSLVSSTNAVLDMPLYSNMRLTFV
jgi:hypothetical protein